MQSKIDAAKQLLANQDLNRIKTSNDIDLINAALKITINNKQWNYIRELYTINGIDQSLIDEALKKAYDQNNLDEFKAVFWNSQTQPSKECIKKILKSASNSYEFQWVKFVDFLCCLQSENKPGQEEINYAIIQASKWKQWDLVQKIYTDININMPSQTAIDEVLEAAYNQFYLDKFKAIFWSSQTQPSKERIKKILKSASDSYEFQRAEFVDCLCCLQSENKPDQEEISYAIKRAAEWSKWNLVQKILINAINKPSQSVNESLLLMAAEANQEAIVRFFSEMKGSDKPRGGVFSEAFLAATQKGSLSVVRYFCQLTTEHQPNQVLIAKGLKEAAIKGRVTILTFLLGNDNPIKPDPAAVVEAFIAAISSNEVKVVDYFCQLTTEHQPSPELIAKGLKEAAIRGSITILTFLLGKDNPIKPDPAAVAEAFIAAISLNKVQVVRYFCQLTTEHQPNPELIAKGLNEAASKGHLQILIFLLGKDNPIKSDPAAVAEAFIAAISSNEVQVVDYFCQLTTEHRPSPELIAKGLNEAASKGHLQTLTFLLGKDNPIKPDAKTIADAFIAAISFGYDHIVELFIHPKNNIQLAPETKDKGLLAAVTAPNEIALIQKFLKLHQTSDILSDKGIEEALLKAKAENKKELCTLLENPKKPIPEEDKNAPKPSDSSEKNQLVEELLEAISQDDLPNVKIICALVRDEKLQMNDIKKALQKAKSEDVKNCLISAQQMLQLHHHLTLLKSHGEKLKKEEKTNPQGERAVTLANQLKGLADNYTTAYFKGGDIKPIQEQFSSALRQGFKNMDDHREKWKHYLANIALAASVIGLLIKKLITGHTLFSNTKRQSHVRIANEQFEQLTGQKNKL
jgi:hypothetical protein